MSAMIRRHKVLFLSSWYPNKILPANGNFSQKHAEAISLTDDLVVLHVCSGPFLKKDLYEVNISTIRGVYTIVVYYKKPRASWFFLSGLIRAYRYLAACRKGVAAAVEKLGSIDIVHHNVTYPAGILALLLKYRRGIPYLITEHWSGYLPANEKYFRGILRRLITRSIANNAEVITPVSNDLKNAMQHYHGYKTRFKVIPNVVDVGLFQRGVRITDKPRAGRVKKKMLHVSSLDVHTKNITGMLHAVKQLSVQRDDFEFHVVSDGDAAPHIHYARELGLLDSRCFFHGPKTTEEISAIMQDADFFVLFSTTENLPCVLVESLASGLPFIVTKVGGIPELFSNEFGIMIESGDEQALLQAMNTMLDTYHTFNSAKMQAYAREHFSYQTVGNLFHETYSEILDADQRHHTLRHQS